MHIEIRKGITWVVGAMTLAMIHACGSSSSGGDANPPVATPPPADPIVESYSGPGSKWDATLNEDGTFEATRRPEPSAEIDLTVTGTYERSAQGFIIMTITAASGENPPEEGQTAWAIDAPGYALMLFTDGDSFVPMVRAGDCPAGDMQSNWVIAKKRSDADATDVDGDYFGSFSYDAVTGIADLPARFALADDFPSAGPSEPMDVACSGGIAEVEDAIMYLTNNGGAIVHTGLSTDDDASFIFALEQKAVSTLAAVDGNYAGLLFDGSALEGSRVSPVVVECTSGMCSGNFVADVLLGTLGESFVVDLFGTANEPVDGFLTGEVRNEAGFAGNVACMVDEGVLDTTQSMFSCVGQAPGDNARLFNVFFTSSQQ